MEAKPDEIPSTEKGDFDNLDEYLRKNALPLEDCNAVAGSSCFRYYSGILGNY